MRMSWHIKLVSLSLGDNNHPSLIFKITVCGATWVGSVFAIRSHVSAIDKQNSLAINYGYNKFFFLAVLYECLQ